MQQPSSSISKHTHHQHFCKGVLACYHGVRIAAVAAALVRALSAMPAKISESNSTTPTAAAAAVLCLRCAFLVLMSLDLWHTLSTLLLVLSTLNVPTLTLTQADRTLVSAAFLAPWFNTAQAALSNWTVQTDSWPCLYAISMFVPGCSAGFPPAFTLLLWCCVTPFAILNDFLTHCQAPSTHTGACLAAPGPPGCSADAFPAYLSGRGMTTLAMGLVAGTLQILLQIIRARSLVPSASNSHPPPPSPPRFSTSAVAPKPPAPLACGDGSPRSCSSPDTTPPPPHALPFQTLPHLPLLATLGRSATLAQLQHWLLSLSSCLELDADVVLGLVCLPLGLYYTALANLCRLGFSPRAPLAVDSPVELTPNEVFVLMLSCLVLGRTSHHLQTSGLLQQVQDQLDRCVECLTDVFPLHVAKRLLDGQAPNGPAVSTCSPLWCPAPDPEQPRSSCCSEGFDFVPRGNQSNPDLLGFDRSKALTRIQIPCSKLPLPVASCPLRRSGDAELLRVRSLEGGSGSGGITRERRFYSNSSDLPASASAAAAAALFSPAATSPSCLTSRGAAQHLPVLGSSRSLGCSTRLEEPSLCLDVAQAHESVTIFFSDICCFSTWAHQLPPDKVMHTLNDLFTRLDNIILHEMPSLYKIETIGDAYMVASNLLAHDPEHAATAVRFAIRAQEEAAKVLRPDRDDGSTIKMRIGLHSGSVMSGVVGCLRRRFCVFGDVVNMGARTEASCPPGGIQLTSATQELAQPFLQGRVRLVERGEFAVKGADEPVRMFLVEQEAGGEGAEEDWASLE